MEVKVFRKGTDVECLWKVTYNNEDITSETDVIIDISDPRGVITSIRPQIVSKSYLYFKLLGTQYYLVGDYSFVCWVNKGKENQASTEIPIAFRLVSSLSSIDSWNITNGHLVFSPMDIHYYEDEIDEIWDEIESINANVDELMKNKKHFNAEVDTDDSEQLNLIRSTDPDPDSIEVV